MAEAHPQYAQLARRLAVARRAYKRTSALAGAVVFLIEALGTIAVIVAADVLFALATPGRIALFVLGIGALIVFAFRHIVGPLLRPISDQQIALYLEQRDARFEGSLIAATEFGPQHLTGRTAQIVESILDQAILRAGRFDLRKAIDLSRLRKYGVIAVAMVAIYGVALLAMPQAVGRRVARVLTPWRPAPQEIDPTQPPPPPPPLELSALTGDASVIRGGTLNLVAVASRRPADRVNFHFRSLASAGEWKMLPMAEAEQLNTFGLILPDVIEDLEYFVSAETTRTEPHRISVYDPLLIKGFEVTIRYPEYLGFVDSVLTPALPDVSAVIGSKVTVRATTNGRLKSGQFTLGDAAPAPAELSEDTDGPGTAAYTFEIAQTAPLNLTLTDVHGQIVSLPAPATVTALADQPPTVKLLTPQPQVQSNPLGEIAFSAELADDLALAGAQLVVVRGTDPSAQPMRFAMTMDGQAAPGAGITTARARGTLMLEELSPPLVPGEMLMAYVEATDRKGQAMPGDLVQITIVPFETWAVFDPTTHSSEMTQTAYQLEPVLHAAWRLYRTAPQLAPADANRQAEELAATMVDPAGRLLPYFDPTDVTDPEKLRHGENAMKLAQAGHDSLKAHDLEAAVGQLRAAVAELVAAGVIDVVTLTPPPPSGASASASEMEKVVTQLGALVEPPESDSSGIRAEADAAAAAAKQKAEAEALEQAAGALADKLSKSAESKDGGEKRAAGEAEKLAGKAAGAAKEARDAAGRDANRQAAAQDLAKGAAELQKAAGAAKSGDAAEAAARADAARRHFAEAKGKLTGASQEGVNDALARAEAIAAAAARKQGELMKQTDAAGKAPAAQKKDAAGAIAAQQVKLGEDLRKLAGELEALNKAGAAGALKADTAKHVQAAQDQLRKGRLEQRIANAAVKLAAGDTAGAASDQKRIKDALEGVVRSLGDADAARSADAATALKRAKDDAAAAKDKLDKLAGKEAGKAGEAGKKDLAAQAADELARLARRLEQRDFSGGNQAFAQDAKALGSAARDPAKLSDELEKVSARAEELAKITARVQDHLEAEYQSTLKSRELFAAQREECPPEYRPLVNKYFEAIAAEAK